MPVPGESWGGLEALNRGISLPQKTQGNRNMENVKMSVAGDVLTIEVDLSKRGAKSSTGKTTRVASTEGNISIPGYANADLKVGLNVFTK